MMDKEKMSPKQTVTDDVRFEKPTFIDPLTGLFNRYYLYEFLPQEIKKSQASGYPLGVFIMDLDNFKEMNDEYGHLCGDEILRQFSEFLKKSRRQTDMVIRYAGDEFMILLPGVDREMGLTLGTRLIKEIGKACFRGKNNEEVRLTVSIGLALCPDDATDVDRLIDLADKALYLSKEKGREQISCAEEVTLESSSFQIARDSFPCPKFIDRYDEMTRLKEIFDDKVLNKRSLEAVFILAASGVGKTRLLEELNNYAKDRAVIISSRGSFKYLAEPYYLFSSGLDSYLAKIGDDSLEARALFSSLSNEELAELAKLLPQIKKAPGSSSTGKQARSLLFKAFLNFLVAINKNSALVLSFDDTQWADNASLELLHYLIKYEKKLRILILFSFQDKSPSGAGAVAASGKEGDKADRIRQFLNYLADVDNVVEMKLPDLSQRDTYEMIEVMFPGLRQMKELNDLVFEITKGNPAFIEEILKSLAENRSLVYKNEVWQLAAGLESIDIPHSLQATIKRRLKNLDRETKELIVQAAVIGNDFSTDLLKRIGGKNEGYIFEVMTRAQKMHLVKESDKRGNFNFINRDIQDVLYSELDETEQKNLHQKIGQTMVEEHKADLYNVAADLSFHFGRSAESVMAAKYGGLIQEKAAAFFNPAEVIDYLEELSLEAVKPQEEEYEIEPLVPAVVVEAARFVRVVQVAVKNFQLYPAGSAIRANCIKDIYHSLSLILEKIPRLKMVESEKSLVINGRRLSVREAQTINEENFISILRENNIKAVSFIRGLTKEEVAVFVENVARGREGLTEKDIWQSIIKQEALAHIKIEEFSFDQAVESRPEKTGARKKFKDAMMMEFLLGKISPSELDRKTITAKVSEEPEKFAQAMNKVAELASGRGREEEIKSVAEGIKRISSQISQEKTAGLNVVNELSRVIMELDWRLRNKFIRLGPEIAGLNRQNITGEIIDSLPDEGILDLIAHSYTHGENNPLVVKDLIDKVLPNKSKRQKMLPKISAKLSEVGVDKEMVDCLTGRVSWENLPMERRLGALQTLPVEEFETLDMESLSEFLEELLSKGRLSEIKDLLQNLLIKVPNIQPQTRKEIDKVIKGFVWRDSNVSDRGKPLLEILKSETRHGVYIDVLSIVRDVIEDFVKKLNLENLRSALQQPTVKLYCIITSEVFSVLAERLKSQDPQHTSVRESIKSFIVDIVHFPKFFEILTLILLDYFPAEPERIKEILAALGEGSSGVLVDMCLHWKEIAEDTFEGYVLRRRIAGVLRELGEPALNRLKQDFSGNPERRDLFLLLELAGHLAKGELVESIEPILYRKDVELRKQAIVTLAAIGTARTDEILSAIARVEKDKEIRAYIEKRILKNPR